MSVHPVLEAVTSRIRKRSSATRTTYLARLESARSKGPIRKILGCTNFGHAFAAASAGDKIVPRESVRPNLAIVSSYSDMLSAHQPFEDFPALIKQAAREARAPFSADRGLKLLVGNLGRAVIKTSAVKAEHRVVPAPAIVFDNQEAVVAAQVADAEWQARRPGIADLSDYHHGMGRELFAAFRANALGAEEGAVTFNASEPQGTHSSVHAVPVHDHFVFAEGTAA